MPEPVFLSSSSLAHGLHEDARVRLQASELEALVPLGVLHAGAPEIVQDGGHEAAGIDRLGRRVRAPILRAIDQHAMGRQALDRERTRHAHDIAVLEGAVDLPTNHSRRLHA